MAEFIQSPTTINGEPKGPPQACLFVANLPTPEVSEERIRDHFSQFGEVLKVKLIKDRSSRPYAFVQFGEVAVSVEALRSNKLLDGKRLRVERAKVNRTLFIAKLSRNTTNIALREQAQKFGPVESVTIIKNHQTNRSKGCGFVKYTYREDAMDAFVGLKNVNHKWVVEWATSTNDPDTLGVDKFNVFLGGLNPDEVSKEGIEARFGGYGEIESVSLINKEEGDTDEAASLGPRSAFAFVRFIDPSASAAAIEAENGAEWLGRRIRVQYCESSEMKTKRRLTKYSQPFGSPPNVTSLAQFYGASGQVMEPPRPMMMMGGLPMYNMPAASNSKGSYGARGKVEDQMFTAALGAGYAMNPSLLAYTQGPPWLFPQLQQPMTQQHPHHSSHPSHPHHAVHLMTQPQPIHSARPVHSIPHIQPVPQHFQSQQPFQPPSTQPPYHYSQHNSYQPHQSHQSYQSPRSRHSNHHNHSNHQPQQHPQAHHSSSQANHSPARSLHSLQRNREGSTSPNSDDSTSLDGDGGLTQSVAGWVLK